MRVAVSGPSRELTEAEYGLVADTLAFLMPPFHTLWHGAAYGVDSAAAEQGEYRRVKVIAVLPEGCTYNHDAYHDRAIVVARKRTASQTYLSRDDQLAEEADVLYAFPAHESEELRSGTWATIRRFRARGKPVYILPLDTADARTGTRK